MADGNTRLTRRTALKGLGGAVGTAIVGGAGISAFAGSAAAQASLDTNITGTEISNDAGYVNYVGLNADKVIDWKNFDVPVKYIGFKHEIALENNNEGWHQLYPAPGDADNWDDDGFVTSPELPDWSGYGDDEEVTQYATDVNHGTEGTTGRAKAGVEWEIINDTGDPGSYAGFGYDGGGPQDPAQWADDLSVSEDGKQKQRTVTFRTTLRLYDADKNVIDDSNGVGEIRGENAFTVTVTNEDGTTVDSTEDGVTQAG